MLYVTEPELSGLVEYQYPSPPKTGDRPPMTQQSRVSFAEGTTFERERTGKIASHFFTFVPNLLVFAVNNIFDFIYQFLFDFTK